MRCASQLSRMRALGFRPRAWFWALMPRGESRVGQWTARAAAWFSGITWESRDNVVEVRLPEGSKIYAPRNSGDILSTVLETAVSHAKDVYALDQYGAREAIGEGMVVIDVGANVGCFTLLASRLVGPGGRVIAIEPVPDNVECLKRTVTANGLENVHIVPVAAGSEEGELSISLSDKSGQHSAVIKRSDRYVRVKMTTLDRLVEELGVRRVDFIKVDVEGMELEVLQGAKEVLDIYQPRLAVAAYHFSHHPKAIRALLSGAKVRYHTQVGSMARGLETVMFAWPA